MASLFAEAIRAIHFNDSISRLFLPLDETESNVPSERYRPSLATAERSVSDSGLKLPTEPIVSLDRWALVLAGGLELFAYCP